MKTLLRIQYTLLLMGLSLALNASVISNISIRNQNGQSFSLHLNNLENTSYSIQLSDMEGFVFISEKVEMQNDYLKLFNLKNLPVGDYQLSLENDVNVIIQDITVLEQKLVINPAAQREINKPNIQYQSNFLDLNMSNLESELVEVLIRNKNGAELFDEKINAEGKINKRFNLKALPAGNYEILIMTKYYTYQQNFLKEANQVIQLVKSHNQQKKLTEKVAKTGETTKALLPHEVAILNRIDWLNSKN